MCDHKTFIQDIENNGSTNFIKLSKGIYENCTQEQAEAFVQEMINMVNEGKVKTKHDWTLAKNKIQKIVHAIVGTVPMNYTYLNLIRTQQINPSPIFRQLSVAHAVRENSGINEVATMTSPTPNGQKFSCKYNCAYCPEEPGSVRSYIRGGPTAERGFQNDYDPVKQVHDRLSVLFLNGHEIDKLEVSVLGGTWDSYPIDYQEWYITGLYYGANTFYDNKSVSLREMKTLEEEKLINETALVRVIGLTVETRPDQIDAEQIKRLLRYGCTRIQIGVQHLDDRILKIVKRDCYKKDTIRAIRNLKDAGLKVDIHLMPQLPGASIEDDRMMFIEILDNPDVQADQIKIYPCETTPWTKIEKWFLNGTYTPYPNEDMIDMLVDFKIIIHPWIRLNRVVRDALPSHAIAGVTQANLRQIIHNEMAKKGQLCRCIRCREVGNIPSRVNQINEAVMMVRTYEASGGTEYFISMETPDEKVIYGFCRLRLTSMAGYITNTDEELVNGVSYLNEHAFIRELHVYGRINRVNSDSGNVQNRGFGRMMIAKAEMIAMQNGYTKMAIISGVGVREYYRKFGYELTGAYMTKIMTMTTTKKTMQPENDHLFITILLTGLITVIIIRLIAKFYYYY
jgi:ELP3 family radical SAM enzyme/protein acetyltransferase